MKRVKLFAVGVRGRLAYATSPNNLTITRRRIVVLASHGSPPPSGKPTARGRLFCVECEVWESPRSEGGHWGSIARRERVNRLRRYGISGRARNSILPLWLSSGIRLRKQVRSRIGYSPRLHHQESRPQEVGFFAWSARSGSRPGPNVTAGI